MKNQSRLASRWPAVVAHWIGNIRRKGADFTFNMGHNYHI